jgi:2-polyprenyl-3-methyl-5-hydroxy-6-metoxy-1,4-benzoquinol methylase
MEINGHENAVNRVRTIPWRHWVRGTIAVERTRTFFDKSYRSAGLDAQRRYPNEELLRFFGTYYFGLPPDQRRALRVLEVGCGSGANLWMMAREGFDAHGVDLSQEGLALCEQMLASCGVPARSSNAAI